MNIHIHIKVMEVCAYTCYYENCQRSYKTKYNLKRHINSNHLLIKDFCCAVCSKTFASKQNLQGHERLHSQALPKPEFEVPEDQRLYIRQPFNEVREFNFSKIYRDPTIVYSMNSSISKSIMPILPPICHERSSEKAKIKLPIIPILL